ncbi:MAG: hypothetical protein ACPG47_04715 [Leucothrix sp.]
MWVDLLHGLLWAGTLFAVVFTFVLARRIRRTSAMPIERLFVLTFGLLFGITMVAYFLNQQLQGAERSDEPSVTKMAHYEFVKQIYPPLIDAQNRLVRQTAQLNDLQEQILALRDLHPQQAERLQFAYNQWLNERKDLSQLKMKLDRGVRSAWIQHKTQDKKVIASAFSRQAVDWEKIIDDRLAQLQDSQLKVNNAMLDNVMIQNRNLSRLRRGKNANFATSGGVYQSAFSPETTASLLAYFEETSPDLAETLGDMATEINTASQRRRKVRNYSLENPDLKPVLDKVIINWLQLENRSIYYRDQVLYAIQGRYLAVILGTNKRDNQLKRLHKTLKTKIPALYAELLKSRDAIEKSYKGGSI